MTITELTAALVRDGWHKATIKGDDIELWKRFRGWSRCACNVDKPGVMLTVSIYENKGGFMDPMVAVKLFAMLPDKTWVDLEQCALPLTMAAIRRACRWLCEAWEAMQEE